MEKIILLILLLMLLFLSGCKDKSFANDKDQIEIPEDSKVATFAGGCFWCMEGPFEKLDGVIDVKSGYSGGHTEDPTYEEVCTDTTGHAEAIQVFYNPEKITYEQLLDVFWKQIDPTDTGGQFVDRGNHYRTAIFYHNAEQKKMAEKSKESLNNSGIFDKPVVTEITEFTVFYPAEDYHQDYYKKCPVRYKMYKSGSGREAYINKMWE